MASFAKDQEREIQNDSEVEDLCLRKFEENMPDLTNKPLSPILSNNHLSRKFLHGRRVSNMKSRVKLSERFEVEKIHVDNLKNNPVDSIIQDFNDESFTISQTESLVNRLDKLEEIENNRRKIHKLLINAKEKEFCFKKPILSSPVRKHITTDTNKSTSFNNNFDLENDLKTDEENLKTVFVDASKCSGFQTATGKSISVSENDIKKHLSLFDDILTLSQQKDISRHNKYSFLSKSKPTTIENCSLDADLKFTQNNNFEQIICSRKDQLADVEFDKTKRANLCNAVSLVKKICNDDQEMSMTQQFCDSEISNTQLLNAIDNLEVINTVDNKLSDTNINLGEFPGFTQTEILHSVKMDYDFIKLKEFDLNLADEPTKQSLFLFSNYNFKAQTDAAKNKRVMENFKLPPKKRIKMEPPTENVCNKTMVASDSKMLTLTKDPVSNSHTNLARPFNNQKLLFATDNSNYFNRVKPQSVKDKLEMFDDIIGDDNFDIPVTNKNICLKPANNNHSVRFPAVMSKPLKKHSNLLNISKSKPQSVKEKLEMFEEIIENKKLDSLLETKENISLNLGRISTSVGFASAAGKPVSVSEDSLKKATSIFENLDDLQPDRSKPFGSKMQTATNNKLASFNNAINDGFSSASGKAIKLSESSLKTARTIFDNLDCDRADTSGTDNAGLKNKQELSNEHFSNCNTPVKSNSDRSETLSAKRSKRKLGISSCKLIPISANKLNRAKLLFDEDFSGMSPIKPLQGGTSTAASSTPIRQGYSSTPIKNNSVQSANNYLSFENPTLSAFNMEVENDNDSFTSESLVIFDTPTKGDVTEWIKNLEDERKQLEDRLKIVKERQMALAAIQSRQKSDIDKRPRPGVLYESKRTKDGIPILAFVNGEQPGDKGTINDLFLINPQNAEKVHFKECSPLIITHDDATLIPNSKNRIGLAEIEHAINTMPGVEIRLIPKGWISNHYKWIVWKLASYERMFPKYFQGCFCIENVLRQLKYRYDREIDKAERSTLRRIYEKDDAPQKRMILCVSDIKKMHGIELELTDGWYGVRTVIDEALSKQVLNGKIQIGTKLVTYGAELLNCDGCFPLEATDLTCLKINCNSTRRARWHARLGYQPFPGPYAVPIDSVHPLGGTIGAINVCIARVYPFKYLEKIDNRSFWRNKKAEERRAQKWENERAKKFEQIEEDIRKELNSCYKENLTFGKKHNVSDVSGITCPETLLEIMENSNDPESIQEKLTSSQRSAVMEYKRILFLKKQEEMSARIKLQAEKIKLAKRDVVAVLKLLVIDVIGYPTRTFNFFIWRPSESHQQILREDKCVTIHNVIPKNNGDLNSGAKTTFKIGPQKGHLLEIFQRRVVQIAELSELIFTPNLKEFDTVGVVIESKIEINYQEVWLADCSGRLLRIKAYEGPSKCLILDGTKRGQATSVCNLAYRGWKIDVAQANADHFTVFSCYSQHKHLNDGLEDFKKRLPKCLDTFLNDCDNRIESFKMKNSNANSLAANLDDSDTLVASRITSTDVALSLIDVDRFT